MPIGNGYDTAMNNGEKPIANPFVVLREEFDDWAVLFDPDTGHAFGLNPTGVYLWKLLDGRHTLDALLQKIRAHADDVSEDVSGHIAAFVDALVAEGLAGFDRAGYGLLENPERAALHPEKYFSSPREALSVLKLFTYETPQLINLGGEQAAFGANCTPGSQATNTCSTGNLACSCSSGTGRSPACCSGACDGVPCGCGASVACGSGFGASGGCFYGQECSSCTNGPWASSCSTGQGT
jgi:SynChlorMet cassette protein ScmD